ncbi:hypothetical protein BLOT_006121 [Blomia tropicalis]|nr:hypothetical protein BLOT_006121 [Blomia tropicalis]
MLYCVGIIYLFPIGSLGTIVESTTTKQMTSNSFAVTHWEGYVKLLIDALPLGQQRPSWPLPPTNCTGRIGSQFFEQIN